MSWVICFFVGLITGAALLFFVLSDRHRRILLRAAQAESQSRDFARRDAEMKVRARDLDQRENLLRAEGAAAAERTEEERKARLRDVEHRESSLRSERAALEARVISYRELEQENAILKRDLQNIDVVLHKVQLDSELLEAKQRELDERSTDLARRYIRDTVSSVGTSLKTDNYVACKDRLAGAIERVRAIGFTVTAEEEAAYLSALKVEYERIVRAAMEREEQARIKARIREEERLRREVERELAQTARERVAIQAALDQALAATRDQHSAEVHALQARLAEAEARAHRAISMAQQTKAGNVYVISNIGSFGNDVFKVGMTRRLEPLDRIRELGDASVPFPFDIHMMISCDDAPALENALHRALHKARINRVNPRKEFFRTDMGTILKIVAEHHGQVQYQADPEALEYNQSLRISEADADFIETVYENANDEDRDQLVED